MTVRHVGRRGGLALRPVYAPGRPPLTSPAGPAAATPGLARPRLRVRWTLVFAAFLVFAGAIVSARFAGGQVLMIAGLVGLFVQAEGLRFGPIPPLLALWTAWSALGYFSSPYPFSVSFALEQLSKLTLISLVGVNALRTRGQQRALCVFVVFAFLFYPGRGTFLNWLTGANLRFGRAIWNGTYANANDLAGIALLILAIALALLVSERKWAYRLAAAGAAGFTLFIIVLTQSRGALIAVGVFVLVALKQMPKHQRGRAFAAVAVMGVVLAVFAPASVWERLSGLKNLTGTGSALTQVDEEGSADQRFEIWKVATTIFKENPVLGVGVGAYDQAHARTAMRPQFRMTAHGFRDTHSTYLNVLAETGVPGFLLFAAIVVVPMRYARRVRKRVAAWEPAGAQHLLYLQLGLVAFLVAGIWGSYAKLNMLYLHLVLIWATARALDAQATAAGVGAAPATAGAG